MIGEGQGRALLLAMGAVEECLPLLVQAEWLRYAKERFAIPSARESRARQELHYTVAHEYDRMRKQAARQDGRLAFTSLRLHFFAIKALGYACPFCSEAYGVMNVGVVWDAEPTLLMRDAYTLPNVVVCCELCAKGKGSLSGASWLDVMQALRGADDSASRQAREAIAAGREVVDGRRAKGTSPGAVPRG